MNFTIKKMVTALFTSTLLVGFSNVAMADAVFD